MGNPRYLTDEHGKRVAVVLELAEYERLLEEAEERDDVRAFDEAMASSETPVPFRRKTKAETSAP
jgi:hypothetical protein